MTNNEEELVRIAQCGGDKQANAAMKKLRELYDPTYMWCGDCDELVCKFNECCLNRPPSDEFDGVLF
jgi:hypothetical protein